VTHNINFKYEAIKSTYFQQTCAYFQVFVPADRSLVYEHDDSSLFSPCSSFKMQNLKEPAAEGTYSAHRDIYLRYCGG